MPWTLRLLQEKFFCFWQHGNPYGGNQYLSCPLRLELSVSVGGGRRTRIGWLTSDICDGVPRPD